jgi:hypothetical protein
VCSILNELDQGSMLWSQFSAIFDNFRWKKWSKFLQKLAVVRAKNANIFAKFFAENILKIITSVPEIYFLNGVCRANINVTGECIYQSRCRRLHFIMTRGVNFGPWGNFDRSILEWRWEVTRKSSHQLYLLGWFKKPASVAWWGGLCTYNNQRLRGGIASTSGAQDRRFESRKDLYATHNCTYLT